MKINRKLLPIKAHFFFFFAALGPILPQLNVFGRHLGVSPAAMGMVTAVLPLLWAIAKPLFGYIVDFWPTKRKITFMALIGVMTGAYCSLWFLPEPQRIKLPAVESIYQLNDTVVIRDITNVTNTNLQFYTCKWNVAANGTFDVYLSNVTDVSVMYLNMDVGNYTCSMLSMDLIEIAQGEVLCAPKPHRHLICFYDILDRNIDLDDVKTANNTMFKEVFLLSDFYLTLTFWGFVALMCVGTVAFNVANCIGDAVCFDVLGDEGSKYGAQRAWGTIGYGITALLGGWLIDLVSKKGKKDFSPAFILALGSTFIDLGCCRALNLPSLKSPEDSGKALREVLRIPRVVVFIIFATVAGTFDSFIIYYMFWFLEEVAEDMNYIDQIKLIEGVIVAAQSFVGELLFFYFSGKIINRFGFGATMTLSLLCYGVRMALISLIQSPWHLVYIEAVMQGPTYALCYSTIVGYAAAVAPPGYSATVQGIVAGMDDGLGFAIGSLVGGTLYSVMGGRGSFRLFSIVAFSGGVLHAVLYKIVTRKTEKDLAEKFEIPEVEKMLTNQQNNLNAVEISNDGERLKQNAS